MSIRSYQDLEVWQSAMDLTAHVYALAAALPRTELYGLRTQLQRAAVSIPSNIAEGHARASTREFLNFCSIAQGSLAELETQALLLPRLGLVAEDQISEIMDGCNKVGRMLRRLTQALKIKLEPESQVPSPQPR